MTVLDDSVAILHGSVDNSLRWMWLSKKHGTTVLAKLDRTGYWFRASEAVGALEIGTQLPRLYSYYLAGVSLAGHATHMLEAPLMQTIVPIPVAVVDEFETEAMF